jgi:hypothetical protein
LVGEPANETEKCFRLDSSILPGPPPSPLHYPGDRPGRRVSPHYFRMSWHGWSRI